MLLLKLSPDQCEMFDEAPEAGMGFHFSIVADELGFILSSRVLMLLGHEDDPRRPPSDALTGRLWFGGEARIPELEPGLMPQYSGEENNHIGALHDAPKAIRILNADDPLIMGFIINAYGYLPPPPPRPSHIYGHLPFSGTTQAGDVFYRCEHWASSRRVRHASNDVLAGTYGFPASELPFVPTGFSAVGRYALPALPPACQRYEITPPPGYVLHCGASVPLYGQAGGGVEVMFPKQFSNATRLPAATVLPPL